MTAKKSVSKVKVKPIKKEIAKPEYKPIFCIPIVEKKIIKRDVNYYGVKQYLKNKLGLDLFKKLRNGDKEVKPKKETFDYKKYYEDMNNCILEYWDKYCVWWYAHV